MSLYFPKDGLGIGHHNHVLEFVYASKIAKNNASRNITTGGNVDLQKLLNSDNGSLEVHSVSAYIDKPLVIGDYYVGYSDEYKKYRLGR